MASELRDTGISVVGDVPWGTHLCHFYETKEDLLDILIPYFNTGLENNEFCVWVVSDPLGEEEAKIAFRQAVPEADRYLTTGHIEICSHSIFPSSRQQTSPTGRIEIVPHTEWYLKGSAFIAEQVLDGWNEKLADALAKGYAGLRANGNEAWLTEENRKDFIQYEKTLDEKLADQRMIVLCSYPLSSSSAAQVFDVVNAHQVAVIRRRGNWEVLETPEVKRAKQEIQRLNEELEQRVVERTRELAAANEELRREIAERQQAEDALRGIEDRLRLVLETLPVGVAVTNRAGDIVLINAASKRIWGGTIAGGRERWKQTKGYWHDSGQRIAPESWASVRALSKGETSLNELIDIETYDGQRKIIRNSAAPVRDSEGLIVGAVIVNEDVTNRVRAEEALNESETKLKQAQHLADIGYWERDLIADRITWSEETGRILGLESFSGVPNQAQLYEFIHPDDRQHHQQVFNEALQGSRLFDVEVRFVRPDGGIRFVHVRDEIVRDEAGKPIRMFGAVQDITHLKQAEEAVRRSEEHLRLVIDTIPIMAWSGRPDGVVDFLNQRWLDYAGLSLEQYVKDPTGPIHPDDIPRVMEKWRAQRAIGEGYEDEMRLRAASGEYRWFLVRTEPLRDEQGNLVKWYGSSTDIEDRKQAEEKLQHSKVQLAQAQRLAHIGSWDWDLRTNAVTWSDELYHIFGLQPGTISVAGEVDRFIHPDDLDLGWDTVKRAVASKEPYDYYHRILRADGTERIARSRGSIMSDERGEPIKVFGATQDVTELKRAEESLKETSEQLRALSANLQSAREEESKRIAREIHDELGGALTSWRWDLEEIRDMISEPLDSSQVAALQTKFEAMIKLTTTTLDTVRRLASELRPMALDELGLVEAIEWQALQFQTRTGIAVEYECSQEKVDLNSEQSTAVFRILQETLTNVLRHAQATEVTITMKQESGEFFLAIKDNGRGITESEKSGARSLGLLGMRERAHLIGAQIDIIGIEGKGTLVAMRIPISESSEREKKS